MRTRNAIKNLFTTIIPYFLIAVLGFAKVRVFLGTLGEDIYTLHQLFAQIFSYLSIVEAGAGALVTQLYYKALLNKNENEIRTIYTSSKYTLKKIAVIIFVIGVGISFFLGYLTNNNLTLGYMQLVFVLYLLRSILDYLMLSPRFVLQADQKLFKINIITNIYRVIEILAEIVLLKLGMNYVVILIGTLFIRMLSYYVTNHKIYRIYPWLTEVPRNQTFKIKGMGNVFAHRISEVVYSNTDILLLSSFLTTKIVTIYSSYNYVIKFVKDISYLCMSAITPSLGNIMAKENDEEKLEVFEQLNMVFLSVAMIIAIVLYVILTPFVSLWIGETFLMGKISLALMIAVLFYFIAQRPIVAMNEVSNLFKETQKICIAESGVNLLLSLILVMKWGMVGVLAATAIATLLCSFWAYPYTIYKSIFSFIPWKYYLRFGFSFGITILLGCLGDRVLTSVNVGTSYIGWFFNSAGIAVITAMVVCLINFCTSKVFRKLVKKEFAIISGLLNKKTYNK